MHLLRSQLPQICNRKHMLSYTSHFVKRCKYNRGPPFQNLIFNKINSDITIYIAQKVCGELLQSFGYLKSIMYLNKLSPAHAQGKNFFCKARRAGYLKVSLLSLQSLILRQKALEESCVGNITDKTALNDSAQQ